MNGDDRKELGHLYELIVQWRREDSDRLIAARDDIIEATQKAVDMHATDCQTDRLTPMAKKVDWLYENAQKQCAEARLRRRWQKLTFTLLGALCTAIGVATPYILQLL